MENTEMREKFEQLFTELSIKEAQWCEKEEQLNLKVWEDFSISFLICIVIFDSPVKDESTGLLPAAIGFANLTSLCVNELLTLVHFNAR